MYPIILSTIKKCSISIFISLIFNTLCLFLGIGCVVISAIALYNDSIDDALVVSIYLLYLSPILIVTTMFGYTAIIEKRIRNMSTYGAIMLCLLAFYFGVALMFATGINVNIGSWKSVNSAWTDTNYNEDLITYMETKYDCCGVHGPHNYIMQGMELPISCIRKKVKNIYDDDWSAINSIKTTGCLQRTLFEYNVPAGLVGIFTWLSVGAEICSLLSILCLIMKTKVEKNSNDVDLLK